jgi:serine/threonine protein kinase
MSTDSRPATSRAGTQPGGGWTPPTVEHLQALLPQYEITAMLGHGGMGAVYQAVRSRWTGWWPSKCCRRAAEDEDAKFVERFTNEARTMAKMNHPAIVAVHDFGETSDGLLYFVMEYIDGTDVAKMIQSRANCRRSTRWPSPRMSAMRWPTRTSTASCTATSSPRTSSSTWRAQVKVADFGLAKHDPAQTSGLTKGRHAMGTPDYVAPEALITGCSMDGRADLYAMGVMLYQMLTGEIPRGLFQMPNVRTKGETDPRFDAIISKAMQTDRESRYQICGGTPPRSST